MNTRSLQENEIKDLYDLYIKHDFPINELRPLREILRLVKTDLYICYGYFENSSLLAYACLARATDSSYALLDYLAVIPEQRQSGIGGRFLQELKQSLPYKGLFIEAETPTKTNNIEEQIIRQRRIDFYEKNDAELTNISGPLFGTFFSIMYLPIQSKQPIAEQSLQAIKDIYREITPLLLFKLFVHYKIRN